MSDMNISSTINPLDNPFWQFSLKVHQADGLQALCHDLQDNDGANVNLLLYCCWLAYEIEEISQNDFNRACESISSWHETITTNLRKVRRSIEQSGEEKAWLTAFFKRALMDEILSESYQQLLLYKVAGKSKRIPSINQDLAFHYLSWLFLFMGKSIDGKKKKQLQDFVTTVYSSLDKKAS